MPRPRRPLTADRRLIHDTPGLPSREQVAAFIAERGETDVGEMASFFAVRGADRRARRQLVKEMTGEGETARRGRRG